MFLATSLASNRFIYASMFWLYLTSYIVTSLSLQALYCVPDPDPGSQAWVLLERSLDLSVTAFSTHSFPRIPRMRSASASFRSHSTALFTTGHTQSALDLRLTRFANPDRECGVEMIFVHTMGAVGAVLTLVLFPALIYWKLSRVARYHGVGSSEGGWTQSEGALQVEALACGWNRGKIWPPIRRFQETQLSFRPSPILHV
jgi:hypothetical protein